MSAQEYKEGLFYDLSGPVKEVQVNTESDFAVKKVVFLEDGRCTLSIMTFKEDGMPFGWSVNNDGSVFSCSIDYDDQNRISSTTTIDTMADPYQETRLYTYSEDGANNVISDMTVLFTTASTNTATNFEYALHHEEAETAGDDAHKLGTEPGHLGVVNSSNFAVFRLLLHTSLCINCLCTNLHKFDDSNRQKPRKFDDSA